MKRKVFALLGVLVWMSVGSAYAEKARGIISNSDSNYHGEHLQQHLYSTDLHDTGNYLKVRKEAKNSTVLGHLEQADQFLLLELKNGYAKVEVLVSDETSPDSWVGLTGWVDADYIDCNCSVAQYHSKNPAALSSGSEEAGMPASAAGDYLFSSGAGAWGTFLTLQTDGSFIGDYGDSDMGDIGEGYPHGIHYFCSFQGQFADWQKVNGYTYSMRLDTVQSLEAEDHIQGGIKYIASEPYGLERGTSFLLFTPETPMNVLPESFLEWMRMLQDEKHPDQLGCYAIYNVQAGYVFYQ